MRVDWKRGAALCLVSAALAGCGVPDQAASAPPSPKPSATVPPTPTHVPDVSAPTITPPSALTPDLRSPVVLAVSPEPTSSLPSPVQPTYTPYPGPTDPPTPTIVRPSTPALPLDQAMGQLNGNVLLYLNLNTFFMLTDGWRELWLAEDSAKCAFGNPPGQWWSADGRFVAMTRDCRNVEDATTAPAGFSGVALWDAQTGEFHRLGFGEGETQDHFKYAAAQGWSPTAPQFLMRFTEAKTISDTTTRFLTSWSIVDAPTRTTTKLMEVEDEGQMSAAAWSPGGATIAILAYDLVDHQFGLYLIGADGSNPRRLAQVGDDAALSSSAWSPDGRFVYLSRHSATAATYQAVQVAVADGALSVIADNQRVPTELRWSPDGNWYLMSEWSADELQTRWSLHRADGALVRVVASDPASMTADAAWMPDSRRMIVVVKRFTEGGAALSNEVMVLNVDGVESVIARYSDITSPSVAIAPDGTLLALSTGSHITILDPQGQEQASFDGWGFEWRPQT